MFIFRQIKVKKRARFRALALALALAMSACAQPTADDGEALKFVGQITDVRARSLLELESLRVTDAAGASMRFRIEGGRRFDAFSPSHAREHMLTGEPVEVTYRELDGALIILELSDAPPAAPPARAE